MIHGSAKPGGYDVEICYPPGGETKNKSGSSCKILDLGFLKSRKRSLHQNVFLMQHKISYLRYITIYHLDRTQKGRIYPTFKRVPNDKKTPTLAMYKLINQ